MAERRTRAFRGLAGPLGSAPGLLGADRLGFPLALLLAALLWGLSLPPHGQGILAILAFIPALVVLPEVSPRKVLLWGWLGGALWEAATLWWLAPTVVHYGGISLPVAAVLVALLSALLGLYTAGYLFTVRMVVTRRGEWGLAFAPLAWVVWEWARGWVFGGMPWWGPGYGLSTYTVFLQGTRLLGVLGLSALAVLAAAAAALWLRERRSRPALWMLPTAVVLLAALFAYGFLRLRAEPEPGTLFRIAFLQPEISQSQKWDPAFAGEVKGRLERLSMAFENHDLDLLVWPESATPLEWDGDPAYRGAVSQMAADLGTPILLGSILRQGEGYVNGAVVVLPQGGEGGRYAKTHLVPFGEYVPLRAVLGFARPLVEAVGDFEAGTSVAPLEVGGAKVGVNICFEGIFPRLIRRQVASGAEVLVNVTNDAWYAGTPGPLQHFLIQRVRAVETGRCLVRSANGGISGLIGPDGTLERTTLPGQPDSNWGNARLLTGKTPYVRIGDAWLWGVVLALGLALAPRRKEG